jgi:hypothetical protein
MGFRNGKKTSMNDEPAGSRMSQMNGYGMTPSCCWFCMKSSLMRRFPNVALTPHDAGNTYKIGRYYCWQEGRR